MLKKVVSLLVVCAMTAGLASGCSGAKSSSSASGSGSAGKTGGKTTIEMWDFGGLSQEQKLFKELADEYNKSQSEVQVNVTLQDWASRDQKVLTAYKSGVAPDLIALGPAIDSYRRMGLIKSISDLSSDLAAKIKKDVLPDAYNLDVRDGKLWAVPSWTDLSPYMMYNVDELKAAGFDPNNPPQTWNDFEKCVKAMTKNGVSGYTSTLSTKNIADPSNEFIYYLWLCGGDIMDTANTKITFNSQAGVNAAQFLTDLNLKDKVMVSNASNITYMDRHELFFGGKIATDIGYTYLPALLSDYKVKDSFHYIYAPMPKPDNSLVMDASSVKTRWLSANGDIHVMSSTKKTDAVLKYLNWLVDNDYWSRWASEVKARTPISIKSYTDSTLRSDIKSYFPNLVTEYDAGTLTKGAAAKPTYAGITEIQTILANEIQQIVTGKVGVKKGLDAAAQQSQQLLDEYNKSSSSK